MPTHQLPTCTPSRKSIQFGKTPGRLGYTFVHDVLALQRKLQWKDETSLADVLKAADEEYVTAHFGKGMGNERMETIGYDVTDEFESHSDNGNFHGEFISLKIASLFCGQPQADGIAQGALSELCS